MTALLTILKWMAYILAGSLLLIFITLLGYRIYLKHSTKIKTPNGMTSLLEVTLGDLNQWIFIRSVDKRNPVLLFLHGGPGAPMGGMPSSRQFDGELIKHFSVVHWDQRGAGKSYNNNISTTSMTYDRLVEDCHELIDYLRNKFEVRKVFLVGHSAGSIIGIKMVQKYPDKIHAYVGVSQIINNYEQQRLSYDLVLKEVEKSGDEEKLLAIKGIGPPPYETYKKELEKAQHIVKYGGFIHDNAIKQLAIAQTMFLTSPEYNLSEGVSTLRNEGLNFTMNALWKEIKNIDFINEIRSVEVPVSYPLP